MKVRMFVVDYKDEKGQDMHREHYITGEESFKLTDLKIIEMYNKIYEDSGYEVAGITELYDGYHYSDLHKMQKEGRAEEAAEHARPFFISQRALEEIAKRQHVIFCTI